MTIIELVKAIRSIDIEHEDIYSMEPFSNRRTLTLKKAKEIAEAIKKRESDWDK